MKQAKRTYNALLVGGSNSKFQMKGEKPAGFLIGVWHGLIAPITFVISLFSPNVSMYETANNGGWYNFGFLLGVGAFSGGAKQSSCYR